MKKILVCLFCLVSMRLLGQGIPYGVEFQVNTYTKDDQWSPVIASLQGGGFVVCWVSDGQGGSDYGVYGQLFSSGGKRIGAEFRVDSKRGNYQFSPAIAPLKGGGFVVCWISIRSDDYQRDVYSQLFSSEGKRIGAEFRVNTNTDGGVDYPVIAPLEGGGFWICWIKGIDLQYDVYGQLFSSQGDKIGSEFRINTYTGGWQRNEELVITPLEGGGFVVCWTSLRPDDSQGDVYGQLFSSGVEKIGTEFRVNTSTEHSQGYEAIAPLEGGGFVVFWKSDGQVYCPHCDTYGQLFSSGGERTGDEFRVDGVKGSPVIAPLQGGGFVVCLFSKKNDGSKVNVYGQFFSSGGERIGAEFRVNTYPGSIQANPAIASLQGGEFVVCWQSMGQDGSDYGIFGKCFPEFPLIHTLKPFGLLEPLNDSSIKEISTRLSWQQPSEQIVCYSYELNFKVFVDDNPDFTSPQIIEQDQDTTLTLNNLQPGATYFWKVLAKNIDGDSLWSSNVNGFYVRLDAKDAVEQEAKIPEGITLEQNYPNPFNPSTEIKYSIPSVGFVTLKIYDIQGRLIRVLYDGNQTAGSYSLRWDGKDESGQDVSSGIYLYKLSFRNAQGQTTVINRKMGLVR